MHIQKLILWDFDGTLADCPGLWRGAVMQVLDEQEPNHRVEMEAIRPFLRDGFLWHKPEETHCHIVTADEWWENLMPVFVRAYQGLGFNHERAGQLASMVRRYYLNNSRFKLYDDAIPALARLKNEGWRHYILSNHVPELGDIVNALGLTPYIDRCISSGVSGYEKPNPQAFLNALRLAGNPEKVWMVGDNPDADIRGAEAVGIKAILVHKPAGNKEKFYAADLNAVAKIISTDDRIK